jgi:hypothetical protein
MPQLVFPLGADGPKLEVLIGLPGKEIARLHAAGQPILAPIRARALLDSGCDVTAIVASIALQLGLTPAFSSADADGRWIGRGGLL